MDERGGEERLPWLNAAPASRSARPAPQSRHTRSALLVLLALFLAAAIGVLAFLAGRSTAPTAIAPPPVPSVAVPIVPPVMNPPASLAVEAPSKPHPAAAPVKPDAPKPKARRTARRERAASAPPVRRARPARTVKPQPPRPRRTARASRAARPRAPGIVQLGAYVTRPQLDAAWRRLVRAHPPLATLPRTVTIAPPMPGRPVYYRLRLHTRSRAYARGLCNYLHGIGRGCIVVVRAK